VEQPLLEVDFGLVAALAEPVLGLVSVLHRGWWRSCVGLVAALHFDEPVVQVLNSCRPIEHFLAAVRVQKVLSP